MRLTKQHLRLLNELSLRDGRTVQQLGLRSRRALQTLNGLGLVWSSGQHGERWHLTDKGHNVIYLPSAGVQH